MNRTLPVSVEMSRNDLPDPGRISLRAMCDQQDAQQEEQPDRHRSDEQDAGVTRGGGDAPQPGPQVVVGLSMPVNPRMFAVPSGVRNSTPIRANRTPLIRLVVCVVSGPILMVRPLGRSHRLEFRSHHLVDPHEIRRWPTIDWGCLGKYEDPVCRVKTVHAPKTMQVD